MISTKMTARINEQINREIASAYLYLAMSARMTEAGYDGVGHWLMLQYHEEMFHAMKFFSYLQNQGASVKLDALGAPEVGESSVKEIFERVLSHEQGVTKSIHEIMALALEENDYATEGLARWFVDEQVEEEKNATDVLRSLELIGNTAQGSFMVNIELGKRALTVPTDFTQLGG